MSVELSWPVGPDDDCVSPWGVVEYTAPRPDLNEVGHLMLAMPETVTRMLTDGPDWHHGALHSATTDGDRIFAHIDYQGHRWTWELFEAHFADDAALPNPLYVGRWPD